MPKDNKFLFFIFTLLSIIPSLLQAQVNSSTLTVYLDCRGCDGQFVRSEIKYVNFVRDQSVAEVQLLVTLQGTGGGGSQYVLDFIGLGSFDGQDNSILFITPKSDTNDIKRNKLVKYIELGLIHYLTEKDVITDLRVDFVGNSEKSSVQEEIIDPWNGWTFELGLNANLSGEETKESYRFNGNIDVRRTTENWKTRFEYWQNYNLRTFYSEDSLGNEIRDEYIEEKQNFFGLIGKTLSDHLTIGSYLRGQSSTQNNIDLKIAATPSIEYSLFPYNEFNRREVTFRYGMLVEQNVYTDTTIYNKIKELLLRQELAINTRFTQPWGRIDGRINAGNYMHDVSKNRLDFNLSVNMRVSRLFSFNVSGRYSIINDQLSLAAGDASDAELLLNLKNQATSYNFGGACGIEFNFGSLYNNVVNSRL